MRRALQQACPTRQKGRKLNYHIERRTGRPRRVAGKLRPGHVTYTVRVFVDKAHGGPRRYSAGTFDLEREAIAAGTAEIDAHLAGTYRPRSTMTVAELCERWLSEYVISLRPASERNYRRCVERKIVPYLGAERADLLAPAAVSAWLAELLTSGREGRYSGGMAPKYVRQVRFVLHAAYEYAVEAGLASRNPVDNARGPAVPRREGMPPTVEEMRACLEALVGTRYHVPFAIAAGTGMRRGEVLGLDWTLVDLATRTVYVRRQLADSPEGPVLTTLKTVAAFRDIELPPFACAILDAERRRQQAEAMLRGMQWTERAFVCQGHDGGPIPPDYFSRGFTGALKRRGLGPFRFHDLRHAYATTMLELGQHPDVVQQQLGHANVAVTMGIYAHVRPGRTAKAVAVYGLHWDGTASGSPQPVAGETGHQPEPNSAPADELAQRRARKTSA